MIILVIGVIKHLKTHAPYALKFSHGAVVNVVNMVREFPECAIPGPLLFCCHLGVCVYLPVVHNIFWELTHSADIFMQLFHLFSSAENTELKNVRRETCVILPRQYGTVENRATFLRIKKS